MIGTTIGSGRHRIDELSDEIAEARKRVQQLEQEREKILFQELIAICNMMEGVG